MTNQNAALIRRAERLTSKGVDADRASLYRLDEQLQKAIEREQKKGNYIQKLVELQVDVHVLLLRQAQYGWGC